MKSVAELIELTHLGQIVPTAAGNSKPGSDLAYSNSRRMFAQWVLEIVLVGLRMIEDLKVTILSNT